jgi:hypothetical protein
MSPLRLGLYVVLAIALRVTPAISFAPATLTIYVRVHPEPTDRKILVVANGPNYYRESEWVIDPERCPKLFSYPLKDLPAGIYSVRAEIGDWSSVRASDRVSVDIR